MSNIPNLVSGVVNSKAFSSKPIIKQPNIQVRVPKPTVTYKVPISRQPMMATNRPVQLTQQLIHGVNRGNVIIQPANTFTIFGQTFQKMHVYIVGFIIVIIIGFMVWKWYNGKNKNDNGVDDNDVYEDGLGYVHDMRNMSAQHHGPPPGVYRVPGAFQRRMPYDPPLLMKQQNNNPPMPTHNVKIKMHGPKNQQPQPNNDQQIKQNPNQPMTQQQFNNKTNNILQEMDI